jgi:hypothetical protein
LEAGHRRYRLFFGSARRVARPQTGPRIFHKISGGCSCVRDEMRAGAGCNAARRCSRKDRIFLRGGLRRQLCGGAFLLLPPASDEGGVFRGSPSRPPGVRPSCGRAPALGPHRHSVGRGLKRRGVQHARIIDVSGRCPGFVTTPTVILVVLARPIAQNCRSIDLKTAPPRVPTVYRGRALLAPKSAEAFCPPSPGSGPQQRIRPSRCPILGLLIGSTR